MTLIEALIFFLIVMLCTLMSVVTLQNMEYKRKKLDGELDPSKSFFENFFLD